MSVNAFPQNFPSPQQLVDLPYDLLLALWQRTGAGTGTPQVATGLAATGSTIGDALPLTNDWNEIDTADLGTGVAIPAAAPGTDILIQNSGANALLVYPPVGVNVDALAAGAPYSLPAGKMQIFRIWSRTQIRSMQLG